MGLITLDYVFSNWDRRCGIDRRRGKRRLRQHSVLRNLRLNPDRRRAEKRTVPGPLLPQPIGRYRAIVAILGPTLMHRSAVRGRDQDPARSPAQFLVTVNEGLVASVYTGWEQTARQPDGGVYCRIRGSVYRQIGTALQQLDDLVDVERAEKEYERQYQRAYQVIYSQYPKLRGRAEECLGEVIATSGDREN